MREASEVVPMVQKKFPILRSNLLLFLPGRRLLKTRDACHITKKIPPIANAAVDPGELRGMQIKTTSVMTIGTIINRNNRIGEKESLNTGVFPSSLSSRSDGDSSAAAGSSLGRGS